MAFWLKRLFWSALLTSVGLLRVFLKVCSLPYYFTWSTHSTYHWTQLGRISLPVTSRLRGQMTQQTPVRGSEWIGELFKCGKACFGPLNIELSLLPLPGLALRWQASQRSCEYHWSPTQVAVVGPIPLVEKHCFSAGTTNFRLGVQS